ncbi:MAG TPA: hypothetical protein VIS06_18135 [Mycobacteriales bacterium]|jgi:hypothetical protein
MISRVRAATTGRVLAEYDRHERFLEKTLWQNLKKYRGAQRPDTYADLVPRLLYLRMCDGTRWAALVRIIDHIDARETSEQGWRTAAPAAVAYRFALERFAGMASHGQVDAPTDVRASCLSTRLGGLARTQARDITCLAMRVFRFDNQMTVTQRTHSCSRIPGSTSFPAPRWLC